MHNNMQPPPQFSMSSPYQAYPSSLPSSFPLSSICLKRNKKSFQSSHMSTAAMSTRNQNYFNNQQNDPARILTNQERGENFYRWDRERERDIQKETGRESNIGRNQEGKGLSANAGYRIMGEIIMEEKKEECRNYLDSYVAILQNGNKDSWHHNNLRYCNSGQQAFPPKIVKQIYQKQLQSSKTSIQYHYGHLPISNLFYFSIQNLLILIPSSSGFSLSSSSSSSSLPHLSQSNPLILEMSTHITMITQLPISHVSPFSLSSSFLSHSPSPQTHPFMQKDTIFIMWSNWQVEFWAWEKGKGMLNKGEMMKDLMIKINISCEIVTHVQIGIDGKIYYMSQEGEIGRIDLFGIGSHGIFGFWRRKYEIKQYFYRFRNNTQRKYQKWSNSSILTRLKNTYKDIKYYFSQKKTRGIALLLNPYSNTLFTLVQTSTVSSPQNSRFVAQCHRQLRMYNVSSSSSSSVFKIESLINKIAAFSYANPPVLIQQLTQQQLYTKLSPKFLNPYFNPERNSSLQFSQYPSQNLQKFKIIGMYLPPSSSSNRKSNLIILTSTGCRIWAYIDISGVYIQDVVHPPNFDVLINASLNLGLNSNFNIGMNTNTNTNRSANGKGNVNQGANFSANVINIQQKQANNLTVLDFAIGEKSASFAAIFLYRKTIISAIFAPIQYQNIAQRRRQQIYIISYENPDSMTSSSSSSSPQAKSMFPNCSLYRIFPTRFPSSQISINPLSHHCHPTCSSNPSLPSSLPHIAPHQYIFLLQSNTTTITKLRPVDTVLNIINTSMMKMVSNRNSFNMGLQSIFNSPAQLNTLIRKIQNQIGVYGYGEGYYDYGNMGPNGKQEILAILMQIYCDVDGAYYFQEDIIGNYHSKGAARDRMDLKEGDMKMRETLLDTTAGDYGQRSNFKSRQKSYQLYQENQRQSQRIDNALRQQQRKRRLTQRFSISNFRSYQYSDLQTEFVPIYSSASCYPQRSSPLRPHSPASLLSFIQNLITHLSLSFPSSSSQTSTCFLSHSLLLYPSRLLSPIWFQKLPQINYRIFPYLIQVIKKVQDIFQAVQKEIRCKGISYQDIDRDGNGRDIRQGIDFWDVKGEVMKDLNQLAKGMREYTAMVGNVDLQVGFCFGEGLGIQRREFQEPIFNALQKKINRERQSISSTVNNWRNLFPSYLSLDLFKTLKIQAQLSAMLPKQKKKSILQNYKMMPHYLLYIYFKDNTLSKKQFSNLLQLQSTSNRSNLKNLNHLIMVDILDPIEKIEYSKKQLTRTDLSLQQKNFLVRYSLQNLPRIRNLSPEALESQIKYFKNISKILQIQQLICTYITNYQKAHPKQKISQQTKRLLNNYLLTPTQLKGLVRQLKNPQIQLVCLGCFGNGIEDSDKEIQKVLRIAIYDDKESGRFSKKRGLRNGEQVREMLVRVIRGIGDGGKLALGVMAKVLDQIAEKQIKTQDLSPYLTNKQSQKLPQLFWVPIFLSQWSWQNSKILSYYMQSCTECKPPNPTPSRQITLNLLKSSKHFLYCWLSAFTLVKYRYEEGRPSFIVFSQRIGGVLGDVAKEGLG